MDTDASPPATPTRQRSLQDSPGFATLAVEMLQSRLAVLPLGADDARALLPFLHRLDLPQGCALFKEGQRAHNDHMLLILEGQVSVDTAAGVDNVAMSVVGPGQTLGELALLDDQPRSTTCTTLTPVIAAVLSRSALQRLADMQPLLAARLMARLAAQQGERLRALGDQLQMYAQVLQQQREAAAQRR